MPRFSIIIPCHNQASLIRDAVDSALAQDYSDKEVIVVDDYSTDASRNILESYGDRIKLIVLANNQGASAARNWGASAAAGAFLVFLDGDDLLLPWALDVYARIIDLKDPKLILADMLWFEGSFSAVNLDIGQKEIAVVEHKCYFKKDRRWGASSSAMVVEQQSFHAAGGWSPKSYPTEDLDLALKLGCSGRMIQIVSPQTTAYRLHANNASRNIPMVVDATLRMIQKEQTGQYPGGAAFRFERYAIIGGAARCWLRRALQLKLYRRAFELVSAGWFMILAALCRKLANTVAGRKPVEELGTVSQLSNEAEDETHTHTIPFKFIVRPSESFHRFRANLNP